MPEAAASVDIRNSHGRYVAQRETGQRIGELAMQITKMHFVVLMFDISVKCMWKFLMIGAMILFVMVRMI